MIDKKTAYIVSMVIPPTDKKWTDWLTLEIKSLLKEHAMEILNELESKEEFVTYKKDNGHGIAIPVSHLIEQREKAGKI